MLQGRTAVLTFPTFDILMRSEVRTVVLVSIMLGRTVVLIGRTVVIVL